MHGHGRRTLVATPTVTLSSCACGQVHLDVGAMTLRFDEATFHHVADAVGRAAASLRAAAPPAPARVKGEA